MARQRTEQGLVREFEQSAGRGIVPAAATTASAAVSSSSHFVGIGTNSNMRSDAHRYHSGPIIF